MEYQGTSWNIGENQGGTDMGRQGYEKLIVWQNAYKLRRLVYEISKKLEYGCILMVLLRR